jgi:single-strand DNA-binding protein
LIHRLLNHLYYHQYLKKGQRVYIEGRLQTRNWDAKDGQKKNRTEIVADNMIMLDGGKMSSGAPANNASTPNMDSSNQAPPLEELPTIQQDAGEDISVEDIPF